MDVPATFVVLDDDAERSITVPATVSWYDSRAKDTTRSAEWRLYYSKGAGAIQSRMTAGDLMVIGVRPKGEIAVLLARAGSSTELQLRTLFDTGPVSTSAVEVRRFLEGESLDFVAASLLERLGLGRPDLEQTAEASQAARVAERLIDMYSDRLPSGNDVSSLVAEHVVDVDPIADPDHALIRWIETEAAAFRQWEDCLIERRLQLGFRTSGDAIDVGAFRSFAMTLRQSRVSRAGGALQNHVARILLAHRIEFEPQAKTEKGETPDFLFPGAKAYADTSYPTASLRHLAAKFTVKERWRQVLNEAARIPQKHLLTVDAAVTEPTLDAMLASGVSLCVPELIARRYPSSLGSRLVSVRELLEGPLSVHRQER